MFGERKTVEVGEIRRVGNIQVAVCAVKPAQHSSKNGTFQLRSVFQSIKENLIRSIAKFSDHFPLERDIENIKLDLRQSTETALRQSIYNEMSKGIASLIIDKCSSYKHLKHFKTKPGQDYSDSLFLMTCSFKNYHFSTLTWYTHPDDHILARLSIENWDNDDSKLNRREFEDYVGLHFSYLSLKDYLIEKEVDGIKFFAICTDLTAGRKNDDIEPAFSDDILYLNYCPNPVHSHPKWMIREEDLMQSAENTLSEIDMINIRKGILDDVIRNGIDASKKKFQHPYARTILDELQSLDSDTLLQQKYELSKKIIDHNYKNL